jgi:hypothetical protein
MTSQTEISEIPENRSVSRPTLILTIVLTIAWFAILAIAIGSWTPALTRSFDHVLGQYCVKA